MGAGSGGAVEGGAAGGGRAGAGGGALGAETVVVVGVLAALSLAAGFWLALSATTRKARQVVSFYSHSAALGGAGGGGGAGAAAPPSLAAPPSRSDVQLGAPLHVAGPPRVPDWSPSSPALPPELLSPADEWGATQLQPPRL